MSVVIFLLQAFWYIAPAGLANMMPVLMKPFAKSLAKPIDGGRTINGEPVFGTNKTWRGIIVAPLFGLLAFWLQRKLYVIPEMQTISLINYETAPLWWGAILGFGAILGDLVKSFFKRRFKVSPGKPWFPFDQIDYTIGAMIALAPFYFPGFDVAATVVGLGLGLHILVNIIGRLIRVRKSWI